MEKIKTGSLVKSLIVIWLFSLLICLNSCRKDHDTDIQNPSDQVFSGTYSNAYDKWRLIAIENGFGKNEKAPDFDYLKFSQPGTYEIVKNNVSVEKGTMSKDTAYSTNDLLIATFIPDPPSLAKYINPAYRYFVLKSDTLSIFSTLDTSYSYRFVRLNKWVPKSAEGFHMNTGNQIVLEQNDIEYYDASSHLIYLKTERPLIKSLSGALIDVYVDNTLIYPLVLYPMITSSYARYGANSVSWPSLYPDNLIFIDYVNYVSNGGETDKRNDSRILDVLKKNGKFHEGLTCDIKSVQVTSDSKVKLDLTLTNNDIFDYYYLDPVKTGLKLFHYFTTGLILTDSQKNSFMQRAGSIQPVPWNSWDKGWLSLIKTGEKSNISIVYDQFDVIPPGPYHASFQFPGLTFQIKKSDIQQIDGRIWLGEMTVTKDITIQ
jgi:hypothetical protein